MVGLIGAGKTTWVQEFMKNSSTRYYAIGRHLLYDRWRVFKVLYRKFGKKRLQNYLKELLTQQ